MPIVRCVDCGSTVTLDSSKRGHVFACPICDTQLMVVGLHPPRVVVTAPAVNGDRGTRKPAKTFRF